ncbi:OLC1v1030938C1 [Oldenlandia corymbosa var. corymbosa]|uniref:OLC1v1030938C1 n=1 Tax=Oldenlandia corymbosa var. corymbosa TaxID=529605 RepID=A0AAV1CK98_OLDCO|nr:OLC1v1030938C1 [Oldenlandia corymbosa var. corymbosa]
MGSFSTLFPQILFVIVVLSSCSANIHGQFITSKASRPKSLVLPLTKDPSTGQHITEIRQRTPLVPLKLTVDLGGRSLWVDCDRNYVSSTYRPARCRSALCNLANSRSCGDCFDGPKPGCNNDTCSLLPDNSVTKTSTSGELATDVVAVESTDGKNPGDTVTAPRLVFTCGSTFLLEGLANGVSGMAGLGRDPVGLPSQFASAFSFSRRFALCLGSSSKGVLFIGEGPYIFQPTGVDVSQNLHYTPLFINPVSTASSSFEGEKSVEYFVGVTAIKVSREAVPINPALLQIDSQGNGGTKISTVDGYTVMETSIYRAFTNAFTKAMAVYPGAPRLASVAPFEFCFDSTNLPVTRVGPPIPGVDIVFQDETVSWTLFGANLMVEVKKNVICLGVLDGGLNPRTSIVIGAHQFEDNLLEFDIARSRLGFSETLIYRQTTCSNFNFTSTASTTLQVV